MKAHISVMTPYGQVEIEVRDEKKRLETIQYLEGLMFKREEVEKLLPKELFEERK